MLHHTDGTKQQQVHPVFGFCKSSIFKPLSSVSSNRHPHGGGYDPSYDTRSGSGNLTRNGSSYDASYDSRYGLSYVVSYDHSYDTGYGFRNGFSISARYGASFSPSSSSDYSSSYGASNDYGYDCSYGSSYDWRNNASHGSDPRTRHYSRPDAARHLDLTVGVQRLSSRPMSDGHQSNLPNCGNDLDILRHHVED